MADEVRNGEDLGALEVEGVEGFHRQPLLRIALADQAPSGGDKKVPDRIADLARDLHEEVPRRRRAVVVLEEARDRVRGLPPVVSARLLEAPVHLALAPGYDALGVRLDAVLPALQRLLDGAVDHVPRDQVESRDLLEVVELARLGRGVVLPAAPGAVIVEPVLARAVGKGAAAGKAPGEGVLQRLLVGSPGTHGADSTRRRLRHLGRARR